MQTTRMLNTVFYVAWMAYVSVFNLLNYKVDTASLDLRLKRFDCTRIRFRLKRLGVYVSSRTIYKILDVLKNLVYTGIA